MYLCFENQTWNQTIKTSLFMVKSFNQDWTKWKKCWKLKENSTTIIIKCRNKWKPFEPQKRLYILVHFILNNDSNMINSNILKITTNSYSHGQPKNKSNQNIGNLYIVKFLWDWMSCTLLGLPLPWNNSSFRQTNLNLSSIKNISFLIIYLSPFWSLCLSHSHTHSHIRAHIHTSHRHRHTFHILFEIIQFSF